jgi:hypothetical protein
VSNAQVQLNCYFGLACNHAARPCYATSFVALMMDISSIDKLRSLIAGYVSSLTG